VDENIPLITVQALRDQGHDVCAIHDPAYKGIADSAVWQMCQREGRLLITTDKDFAQYRNEGHYGVLIIRLRRPNSRTIHERVLQAIVQFNEQSWPGTLVVMRDSIQSVWRSA
jgi:predicted nuclease of predicted toxin-antitoxin system